jgi:penicillin-binding protein 1A
MGQGATMALPIWAYYMKKIYADKTLGYSPDVKFDVPEDYNPCSSEMGSDVDEFGIDEVFE